MTTDLGQIETILVAILENRSFDHMLGYLSFLGGRGEVEGLRDHAWQATQANPGTHWSCPSFVDTLVKLPLVVPRAAVRRRAG